MQGKLWYLNADFEMELATLPARYHRQAAIAEMNRKLAPNLLWLATAGDALLLEQPWSTELLQQAATRGVELVDTHKPTDQSTRIFTPWGWSPSVIEIGQRTGAIVSPIAIEIIQRVNSKLFSHAIEQELDMLLPGATIADNFDELAAAVARVCPDAEDKWVIKSPHGFAARDRVLGRGSVLAGPAAVWAQRRFAQGQQLILQPWLQVIREYGVTMMIASDGQITINGISDLQTNGAGTGIGYLLGRVIPSERREQLTSVALQVAQRLYQQGYYGPAGIDALEHSGGLHPLLEINARYTMGFVAVAVEKELQPTEPIFWKIK